MVSTIRFAIPRRLLILPLLIFSTALASYPAHADPATIDWNAAAKQDIKFAADSIRTSHAGAVSGQLNVTVPLESGVLADTVEAEKIQTQQDYRRLMTRFIASFGDPHTGLYLHLTTHAWTGLVIDRIAGQYRVIWSEPDWPTPLPPKNATVQSCDGVWIGTYLKTNVAPFVNHSTEYPTTFSELARQTMFDTGLGWTPKQCVFTLQDHSTKRFDLPLRSVPDNVSKERIKEIRQQYTAKAKPVGLYTLANDRHWVGMPDFNGSVSAAAYENLYKQLATLKKSGWIIFDLRGNGGGDSSWGTRALQAVYGTEYGEKLGNTATYSKAMIVNQATINLFKRFASLPEYAASKDEFDHAVQKLEAAQRAGDKMAIVEDMTPADATTLALQASARPHGPRIAAVIDRGCFSSCMNFLQQIESISDTVVLGEPTIGYSPYGEINEFNLPSGNGAIYIPSAVYTSLQATREPFMPDIAYPGNIADDDALMKWVNGILTSLKPGQKKP
ncbi:S41 family peptidase [Glaciimonas soli]|uniref:Tail specific protease domain-containing protein n=1 Tax=Glaciimonas soli TaxID=2590999 RepID=A0A843YVH6_9BURK|nr:S41 family peptidase [Glaciimonas soli]MQR00606.1 hypothetical protein [Glaciimonas soli]